MNASHRSLFRCGMAIASASFALTVACQPEIASVGGGGGSASSSGGTSGTGTGSSNPGPGTVIATFDGVPGGAAMDDTSIYLSVGSTIYRVSKDGTGGPQAIATAADPIGIAVDDANVYFTDLSIDQGLAGAVLSVPNTGGALTWLAYKQQRPWGIAVDDTNVYWTNQGQDQVGTPFGGGQVVSLAKTGADGGVPTVLVDNLAIPDALVLDGDGIIFHAYATVERVPKAGGAVTTLDNRQSGFFTTDLVVSAGQVYYWSGDDSGVLVSVPTNANDSAPPSPGPYGRVLAQTPQPTAFTMSGSAIYWTASEMQTTQITSLDATTGTQTVVSSTQIPSMGYLGDRFVWLRADAKNLYAIEDWATYATGNHVTVRAIPL